MEVRGEAPATSALDEVEEVGHQGPSWLQLGSEMSTEEEALRALAAEISNRTPPLNNIRFTNRYAASYIGGAILDRAADIESLSSMGEMGVDEATNRVGTLISRVSLKN